MVAQRCYKCQIWYVEPTAATCELCGIPAPLDGGGRLLKIEEELKSLQAQMAALPPHGPPKSGEPLGQRGTDVCGCWGLILLIPGVALGGVFGAQIFGWLGGLMGAALGFVMVSWMSASLGWLADRSEYMRKYGALLPDGKIGRRFAELQSEAERLSTMRTDAYLHQLQRLDRAIEERTRALARLSEYGQNTAGTQPENDAHITAALLAQWNIQQRVVLNQYLHVAGPPTSGEVEEFAKRRTALSQLAAEVADLTAHGDTLLGRPLIAEDAAESTRRDIERLREAAALCHREIADLAVQEQAAGLYRRMGTWRELFEGREQITSSQQCDARLQRLNQEIEWAEHQRGELRRLDTEGMEVCERELEAALGTAIEARRYLLGLLDYLSRLQIGVALNDTGSAPVVDLAALAEAFNTRLMALRELAVGQPAAQQVEQLEALRARYDALNEIDTQLQIATPG